MERKCNECGTVINDGCTVCPNCGNGVSAKRVNFNLGHISIYTCAALILSLIILFLSFITAIVDSATFLNRMYTTVLEWNMPLAAIALVVIGFVVCQKEGRKQSLNVVAALMLFVAFIFSNTSKNMVQDHVSNLENYVDVVAEAMHDDAENVVDWRDKIVESADEVEDKFHDARRAESRRAMREYQSDYDYYY